MKKKISIWIVLSMLLSLALPCAAVDIQDGVITIDAVADRDASGTATVYANDSTQNALWWSGNNDTKEAVYKITVPQGGAGLYEFSAFASGQYLDDWNFASVKVGDTEYIAQGAGSVVQYPKAEGWFNSATEANFDWYTPGFVELAEGENTLSVRPRTKQSQGVAVLKLKLTPIDENSYEMISSDGAATIPVNKLTSYTGSAHTSLSSADYLAFAPKSQQTVVEFDVYTQKADQYTLSADLIFAEMPSHVFYFEDVTVNDVSVFTGSSSEPIASTENENTTDRYVKEACVVDLVNGKNTIKVKLGSTRNNNWVKLYAFYLEKYEAPVSTTPPVVTPAPVPVFNITEGSVEVETNEANSAAIESNLWRNDQMVSLRGSTGYVSYKVNSPETCAYDLTLDFNMLQLSDSASSFGFNITVNNTNAIDGSLKPLSVSDYPETGYDGTTVHYTDVPIGKINLAQGDSIIKIEFKETSNSAVDLYKMKLEKAAVVVPTPTPEPTQKPIPSFNITNGSLELDITEDNAVSVEATDWRSDDMIRLRGNGGGATYKIVAPGNGTYNITADFNSIQWISAAIGFGFNIWVNDVLVTDGSQRPLSASDYPAIAYKTTPEYTNVPSGQINLRQGENIVEIAFKESGQSVIDLFKLTFKEFIDPVVTLDENNENNNPEKGSVTNNAGLNVVLQTTSASKAVNGTYYNITYKTNPEFVYKPVLESGKYEVFVNRPVLRNIGKDFLNMTAQLSSDNGSKSVRYSNSAGSGKEGWYSLGIHSFAGNSNDKVTIIGDNLETVNALLGEGNEVEEVSCVMDAVKFVPYEAPAEATDELVIDEKNRTAVNMSYTGEIIPADSFVAAEKDGYGYSHLSGKDYYNTWSKGGIGSTNLFPAASAVLDGAYGTYAAGEYGVDYYPNLTPGYYKVFVNRPAGYNDEEIPTITNRADIFSNNKSESFEFTVQNDSDSNWLELGVFDFAGDYGKEYVKIIHIGGSYSMFDAVRFVRIPVLEAADITVESPILSPTVLRNSVFNLKSDLVLDKSTVTASTVYLKLKDEPTIVPATTSIAENGVDITITPSDELIDGTYYTLVVSGIKDKFGRDAQDKTYDFLVDLDTENPVATLSEPADLSQVSPNGVFKLTFSEDVLNIEKSSSYSILDGDKLIDVETVVTTDKRAVTLIPVKSLDAGKTYTLVVNTAVTDITGNPVGGTTAFKFTTSSTPADKSLTVSLLYPTEIYQLELKPTFTLLFSYVMDAMYANEKFVYIAKADGTKVSAVVKKTGDNSFTITPSENLAQNTVYKIVFSGAIRSATGRAMGDLYDISFKTRFSDTYTQSFSVASADSSVSGEDSVNIKFNAPVDLRGVNKTNILIKKGEDVQSYSLIAVDTNTVAAVPETAWAEGEYTITLSTALKSVDGVALGSELTKNFTAGKSTLSDYTTTVTSTTATGSVNYYNSSSQSKTVTGVLYVIENGVVTGVETVETVVPSGETKPVSAELTGLSAGSGAVAQLLLLENAATLKPASNASAVQISASLAQPSGTQINISGSVTPGDSRKVVYMISKPGATVTNNTSDIIYIGTAQCEADGNFDITYSMPNTAAYGTYNITVNAQGASAPVNLSFENVSEYLLSGIYSSIDSAIEGSDYAELESIITQSGAALGISSDVAAKLSTASNKLQILQSITGADDCAEKVLVGLVSQGITASDAEALGIMAGLSESEAQILKTSKAITLFNAEKPFTDTADVLKNMRAAVAIARLNSESTSDYGAILRTYAGDLGITVPSTVTTSLLNGLYDVRSELTIANFADKYASAGNTPNTTKPTTAGGGDSPMGGFAAAVPEQGITSPGTAEPSVNNSVFTDVGTAHWANQAIEYLYNAGIITGVGDGRFEPEANVTREQFVKMIVVAFDIPIGNIENVFEDVDSDSWYSAYILAAYNAGLINGYSDTVFGVGNMITREDMAVIIYRALNNLGLTLSVGDAIEFSDADEISLYASEAVSELAAGGIMNGMGDGTFSPESNATRAMAAKLIYELLMI